MKKILTFMFAAALLASCQQEENEATGAANSPIIISPIITRATEVNFENGDKIGVTITQSGDVVYANNALMTYNNNVFSGGLRWYAEGNDKSQIVAYYPYNEAGTPTSVSVQTDQSSGYGASDFMAASKSDVVPSLDAISMNFKHMFTNMVINVDKETAADITSIVLRGSIPTASVDLAALTVTADANVAAQDIKTETVTANTLYRAIVVPQTVAFTLEVTTSDNKTLKQRLTSTTLVQGGQYSVDIRVLSDDLEVTLSGEIENWTDQGQIGADDEIPFEEHLDENYFLYDDVRYQTVTLSNGTTWMAEPLAFLPKGFTPSSDPTANAHIWYPYAIENGAAVALTTESSIKKLGYLYDIQAALGGKEITPDNCYNFEGAQGICPKGWHIPTRAEYFNLVGNTTKDADGNVPENGANALFYNTEYDGAKIQSLIDANWNYQFSGVRMSTGYTATPRYQVTTITANNSTKSEWHGNPSMSYYMTSTAYKPVYNSSTNQLNNIQFFGLMSTFSAAKYPEGRLTLSYVSVLSGQTIRCVRD